MRAPSAAAADSSRSADTVARCVTMPSATLGPMPRTVASTAAGADSTASGEPSASTIARTRTGPMFSIWFNVI